MGDHARIGAEADLRFAGQLECPERLGLGMTPKNYYRIECVRDGKVVWVEDFPNALVNVGRRYALRRGIPGTAQGIALNSNDVTDETKYPDGRTSFRNWTVNTAVKVGDLVRAVTGGQAGKIFMCTTAGTTHASTEPTWPAAPSDANIANGSAIATVSDNGVVWQLASHWYFGLKLAGTIADADAMDSHAGWSESTAYSNTNRPGYVPGSISVTGGNTASQDNSGQVAVFNINGSATIAGAFLVDRSNKGGTTGLLYGAGDFSSSRQVQSGDILNLTFTTTVA